MKLILLLITLVLSLNFSVLAQTDTTVTETDTTDVENWDSWGRTGDYDFRFIVFGDEFRGSPTIHVNYGFVELSHNSISTDFSKPHSLELKLGNTYQSKFKEHSGIVDYRLSYIFLSNVTDELSSGDKSGIESESWRFGIGRTTGYGYKLGSAAIIPYNSNAFTWTKLDAAENQNIFDIEDAFIIDRFNKSFRFGNNTEAGIKFQIIPELAIDASFERAVVYERHLFWKWGGSFVIELVGQSLVDGFVKKIMRSSPYAGPVISFLLKNGLSYGMYELRKEKMNWPFASAPALMYEQFKIGATFVF